MPRLSTPKGHTLSLPPRRVSVGESEANDIPIAPGHGLAAVHFHLQPWESGHFLEDAGSGLGTLLNGKLVSWVPLKHGDVITAGELKMTYESGESGQVPAIPIEATLTAEVPAATTAPPPPQPPLQPPAWLPPEALLPPITPTAQAAARKAEPAKKKRRRLPVLLVAGAVLGAVSYFVLR